MTPAARHPWRAAVGVALAAALFWRAAPVWHLSGDTAPLVPTVAEQFRHGTRDLSRHVAAPREGRWREFPPDKLPHCVQPVPTGPGVYSSYPAGNELFAWPALLAATVLGLDPEREWVQREVERDAAYLVTALALALLFLAACELGSRRAAFGMALLLAAGSGFATTLAQNLWQQTGVVFWVSVVLYWELAQVRKPGRVMAWLAVLVPGLACGQMLACRLTAVTFLVPYGLWLLARDRRRGVLVPLAALASFAPWAWLYQSVYGNPFGPAAGFLTGKHPSMVGDSGWHFAPHLLPVLASPARGLLVYQPWLWTLAVAAVTRPRPLLPLAAAVGGLHLLLVASWNVWWGGVCWGSRLMLEPLPLLALAAVPALDRLLKSRPGRFALAATLGLGLLVTLPPLFGPAYQWQGGPVGIDDDPPRLRDWSDPPFLRW